VDITVPMKVVDALFSTAKKDELDVAQPFVRSPKLETPYS